MRFSSIFHSLPTPRRETPRAPERPAGEEAAEALPPAAARPVVQQQQPQAPAPELPDDLDARVRLIGEWQLGEG